MIDKTLVTDLTRQFLEGTDAFPVSVSVTPADDITVTIDSDTGVDIDTCAALTRHLRDALEQQDPEADFSLEVGSAGLTAPFTVRRQYEKNVGNRVEVLTRDGRKMRGTLEAVADDPADPDSWTCTILVPVKTRPEGSKRPVIVDEPLTLRPADIKSISYLIEFK